MTTPQRAYLALGSNLDAPSLRLLKAFEQIAAMPGITLVRRSSLYRTAPVGFADQPDFINAVAEVLTTLSPEELLAAALAVERQQGREREFQNAPRTLDVDVLLYADECVDSATLTLPHPRAHERAFVLKPLLEIAPHCVIPGRGPARGFLPACADQGIQRITDPVIAVDTSPKVKAA